MTKGLVSILAVLILIVFLFGTLFVMLPRYFGAYQVKDTHAWMNIAILAVATFAGVVSNSIYDRIITKKDATSLLRRSDVVLASIVAPVVMLPIYQNLQTGTDVIILALTSYQNGFFFNTLFSKLTHKQ